MKKLGESLEYRESNNAQSHSLSDTQQVMVFLELVLQNSGKN